MDLRTLAKAYDNSAADYDLRFRAVQRIKYRVAVALLFRLAPPGPAGLLLDAGGGTGLFHDWLAADDEELVSARASLRGMRHLVVDASSAMLRVARGRGLQCAAGDLARPPLRSGSVEVLLAFTSILDRVETSLAQLSSLLAPGGTLVASFLAAEAPRPNALARASGVSLIAGPVAAGQDQIFLLQARALNREVSR